MRQHSPGAEVLLWCQPVVGVEAGHFIVGNPDICLLMHSGHHAPPQQICHVPVSTLQHLKEGCGQSFSLCKVEATI